MSKILLTWLGCTDINSSQQSPPTGVGPIAGAVADRQYKEVYILSDFSDAMGHHYQQWLQSDSQAQVTLRKVRLKDPMDFALIYRHARDLSQEIHGRYPSDEIVFALSPGTPAMAAVWIILARTLYQGVELIESSIQDKSGAYRIRTASVPFDISAEPIETMLKAYDEKLIDMVTNYPPPKSGAPEIIYQCKKMQQAIGRARIVAKRNVPVLLLGESGTGKELFAQLIHHESFRSGKQIVSLNCGEIVPTLMESELFGHIEGAFTGAIGNKDGLFCEASEGTLFLDEIGELDVNLQVKLLRVLQENQVRPVGSNDPVGVDVRLITATHKNLMEEVAQGDFREDLFYRLGVALIHIPPLRERGADINELTTYCLAKINKEFSQDPSFVGPKQISPNAQIELRNYSWPGNVRELENTLMRAALWTQDKTIKKEDIFEAIVSISGKPDSIILDQPLGPQLQINDVIGKVAQHYLRRALQESGGNKSKASKLIGLKNHQTFTQWMDKHHITDSSKR